MRKIKQVTGWAAEEAVLENLTGEGLSEHLIVQMRSEWQKREGWVQPVWESPSWSDETARTLRWGGRPGCWKNPGKFPSEERNINDDKMGRKLRCVGSPLWPNRASRYGYEGWKVWGSTQQSLEYQGKKLGLTSPRFPTPYNTLFPGTVNSHPPTFITHKMLSGVRNQNSLRLTV